jgi:hypothetical protein
MIQRQGGVNGFEKILKAKYGAKKIDETLSTNGESLNPVLEVADFLNIE